MSDLWSFLWDLLWKFFTQWMPQIAIGFWTLVGLDVKHLREMFLSMRDLIPLPNAIAVIVVTSLIALVVAFAYFVVAFVLVKVFRKFYHWVLIMLMSVIGYLLLTLAWISVPVVRDYRTHVVDAETKSYQAIVSWINAPDIDATPRSSVYLGIEDASFWGYVGSTVVPVVLIACVLVFAALHFGPDEVIEADTYPTAYGAASYALLGVGLSIVPQLLLGMWRSPVGNINWMTAWVILWLGLIMFLLRHRKEGSSSVLQKAKAQAEAKKTAAATGAVPRSGGGGIFEAWKDSNK